MRRSRVRTSRRGERSGEDGRRGRPRGRGPSSGRRRPRRRQSDEGERPSRRAPVWEESGPAGWSALLGILIRSRDRDLTFWQILEELGLAREDEKGLRGQFALLEGQGLLAHHRRGRFRLRTRVRLFAGRLSIPPRSRAIGSHWGASGAFGFVAAPGAGGDLYIPARGLAGARHGDSVLARETESRGRGRTQGEIVAVLARAPSRFAGEVIEERRRLRIRPRDDRTAQEMAIAGESRAGLGSGEADSRRAEEGGHAETGRVRAGDLVIAEIDEGSPPRARVVEVIGPASDVDSAERLVRAEMGLPGEFPPEAEEEAKRVSTGGVRPEDLRGRIDFREMDVVTIDPAGARDFDDALGFERLDGGALRLWVHIADVGRYVVPGGALDRQALARATSIYLPGSVIPMLPHSLSSGVCSLREGEDRLVQSVGIDYGREAEVRSVRFADGVIRSRARLTYQEAAAAMEDPDALAARGEAGRRAADLLAVLAPLARRLTERRTARGALDLDLPELELDTGKEGIDVALDVRERTASHRLVEEFMLAANEAVARALSDGGSPSLHRVHEDPDPGDVREVEEDLAEIGVGRARSGTLAARLQRIISSFRGAPEEPIVARFVLRAMKLARYSAEPGGHFGLALRHYTHFTSPIRRYPDLVVHRILRAARSRDGFPGAGRAPGEEGASGDRRGSGKEASESGGSHGGDARGREGTRGAETGAAGGRLYTVAELEPIAAESSRLERRAEEAERGVNDLLVAHHMSGRLGEVFGGRVSGRVRSGIFVALEGEGLSPGAVEGFAPVARSESFRLTEPVRVRLEEADLLRGRLRLSLAEV